MLLASPVQHIWSCFEQVYDARPHAGAIMLKHQMLFRHNSPSLSSSIMCLAIGSLKACWTSSGIQQLGLLADSQPLRLYITSVNQRRKAAWHSVMARWILPANTLSKRSSLLLFCNVLI